MEIKDFLQNIVDSGKSAELYYFEVQIFDDDEVGGGDYYSYYLENQFYYTVEEAREASKTIIEQMKVKFGTYNFLNLLKAEISPEELDEVDWKSPDFNIFEFIGSGDDVEFYEKQYDYKSLKGHIIVIWEWMRHIGYCRKFIEVRYAYDDETEKILVEEDRICASCASVLCCPSEIEGLSEKEIRKLVLDKLKDSYWKWDYRRGIDESRIYVGEEDDEDDEDEDEDEE